MTEKEPGLLDYYKILDIPGTSSVEEIRRAFKQKALLWHPDKNSNNQCATELFKHLIEAFKVLTDEQTRLEYDKLLVKQKMKVIFEPPALPKPDDVPLIMNSNKRRESLRLVRQEMDKLLDDGVKLVNMVETQLWYMKSGGDQQSMNDGRPRTARGGSRSRRRGSFVTNSR